MITRFRRDPRQMAEDEEAWFDEEEEEEITALYTDSLTFFPTQTLDSIPLNHPPDKNHSTSPPPAPHTLVSSSTTLPPSTTFTTSTTSTTVTTPTPSLTSSPAPSPFTQVSYSPRPQAALNRAPLVEPAIKTPIVTQVSSVSMCLYCKYDVLLILTSLL